MNTEFHIREMIHRSLEDVLNSTNNAASDASNVGNIAELEGAAFVGRVGTGKDLRELAAATTLSTRCSTRDEEAMLT